MSGKETIPRGLQNGGRVGVGVGGRGRTISGQIRAELKRRIESTESQYAIAKATGIRAPQLSRFVRGLRSLSLANLETLAEYLGLELTKRTPKPKRKR